MEVAAGLGARQTDRVGDGEGVERRRARVSVSAAIAFAVIAAALASGTTWVLLRDTDNGNCAEVTRTLHAALADPNTDTDMSGLPEQAAGTITRSKESFRTERDRAATEAILSADRRPLLLDAWDRWASAR